MKGKNNMNRKKKNLMKVLSLFGVIAISVIGYYSLVGYYSKNFVESTIIGDFPVPSDAQLTKEDPIIKFEQYTWGPASEENGLPFYYKIIIKQWGWEEKSREGAVTFYEKQGKVVSVISQRKYLFISAED